MNKKALALAAVVVLALLSGCLGAVTKDRNVEETDRTDEQTIEAEKIADEMPGEGIYRVEVPQDNRVCYVYVDYVTEGNGGGIDCHRVDPADGGDF